MRRDAWFKGDPKEILSCYALDFVGYATKFSDPKAWDVAITSRDSMKYVASSPELAAKFDVDGVDGDGQADAIELSAGETITDLLLPKACDGPLFGLTVADLRGDYTQSDVGTQTTPTALVAAA